MNCIDSDFAIAVLRGDKEAKKVLNEIEAQGDIFITSISVFEVSYSTKGFSRKKELALMNFLDTLGVLDLDKRSALTASDIGRKLAKSGKMLHPMDLLIGAIALQNNMPFVTRNKKHFERIKGLKVKGW